MYAPEHVIRCGPDNLVERRDFATAHQLARRVTRVQLAHWKDSNAIFAVETNGFELFPLYAFDTGPPLAPLPAIRQILAELGLLPWDVAE